MTTEVLFPLMSMEEPDAEGVVGTWFVNHGETVVAGQVIAEVQVDKVSQDVAEGVGVRQGEPLARIDG